MTMRNDIMHLRRKTEEENGGGMGGVCVCVWGGGHEVGHTAVHVMRGHTSVHGHTHSSHHAAFIHSACKCHASVLLTFPAA